MGIYSILYEDKYGVKPLTAIHYVKFLNGLRYNHVSDEFIEDLKRTIVDVHHKTQSVDPKDYPCKCGGWCEKDFSIKATA